MGFFIPPIPTHTTTHRAINMLAIARVKPIITKLAFSYFRATIGASVPMCNVTLFHFTIPNKKAAHVELLLTRQRQTTDIGNTNMNGLTTNDIATGNLLRDSYFGAPYGGGNFAGDGSAVKEAVRGNRDLSLLESVNRGASDQFITDRINSGHAALSEQIREQHTADRFSTLERLMLQQTNDAQRDRTDILLKVAEVKCCCESNSAKIDNLAALNTKDLEITKLQLQLANCDNHGRGQGNS